ncbi:hypothetical protein ACHAXN_013486 [Cyclotella atomus]
MTSRKRRHPQCSSTLLFSSLLLSTIRHTTSECNYCSDTLSGYIQIPGTSCREYVQCTNNAIGQSFQCGAGLIFDPSLNQCNWEYSVTCGPDYDCPSEAPVVGPTMGPTEEPTEEPNWAPTESPVRGVLPPGITSSGGGGGSSFTSNTNVAPPTMTGFQTIYTSQKLGPNTPYKHEHHAAIFAHLNANKISIYNNIFSRSKKLYPSTTNTKTSRSYSYQQFTNALRTMSEIGYTIPYIDENDQESSYQNTFYLGDPQSKDGATVGLLNIILFLSSSIESFGYNSCDEVNRDEYNGYLAESNSCGQWGLSYQDMHCDLSESHMECPLDYGMSLSAAENAVGVTPFFCGDAEDRPFTGVAGYNGNVDVAESPVQSREGRTDVENCCWWGRGVIPTRGVCQYGKLNYYIGARAKEEGREALLPDIDFCTSPQMICSIEDGNVEWITGLWRWVDGVQTYDDPEWSYIRQLNQFVMGGMRDVSFIEAVSGIVSQGCHAPPCEGGSAVEVVDTRQRWEDFKLVAKTFGLPVKSVQL